MVSGTLEDAHKLRFSQGGSLSTHTPTASCFLLSSHQVEISPFSTKWHMRIAINRQLNQVLTHFHSGSLQAKDKTRISCWQRNCLLAEKDQQRKAAFLTDTGLTPVLEICFVVQHKDSETGTWVQTRTEQATWPWASHLCFGSNYIKAMMSTILDNDTRRDTISSKCSTLFNPYFDYSQPGTADHHYPLQKNHRFHFYASWSTFSPLTKFLIFPIFLEMFGWFYFVTFLLGQSAIYLFIQQ